MSRTELRTEIEIQAKVEDVYAILIDFPRYPEWNPFITSIKGPLSVGAPLSIELSLPQGKNYSLRPRLVQVDPNRGLRWHGRFLFPGLLDAEHFFEVHQAGERVTRFVHGEDFSGLLLGFTNNVLTLAARGFVYMNEALKRRAEAGS